MKRKMFRIFGISLGILFGLCLLCFVIYVILYYPRKAEPFETHATDPDNKILIAYQGSDFKNSLTNILCDSLNKSSSYIRGIDVRDLDEINENDWDKVLIINSFIIRLNKKVERLINNTQTPGKILVFVTSGGADWVPPSQFGVDALTSASRNIFINDLVHLITDWVDKSNYQKWTPDDYLLALNYFPQVDVDIACESIALKRVWYQALYPDLIHLINRAGYQYLRINDVSSALKVFKLNTNLFPDHWNVYDSYGEALKANGDIESAIKNYKKALVLNPDSESAKNQLKKLNRK